MKIKIAYLLVSIFLCYPLYSQNLTESAKGESSLLMRGNNASLNLGEAELSFGLNNLKKSLGTASYLIFGVNAVAKNESGIGNIFDRGYLVPEGKFNGFLGLSWSNGIPEAFEEEYSGEIEKYQKFISDSRRSFDEYVTRYICENSDEDSSLSNIRKELCDEYKELNSPQMFLNTLRSKLKQEKDAKRKNFILGLYDELSDKIDDFKETKDYYDTIVENMENTLQEKVYWQLMVFGLGGINASEFKRFVGYDSTNLKDSFEDESFRGGRGGIGINFQYGSFNLGITYSYLETNNFVILSKKDYTWRSSTSLNNQTVIEEKKIAAYSGAYDNVKINELNIDLLYNVKLDKEPKNHLLINPYLRSQLFSRRSDLLPNSTNVGCGFYFYQQSGVFLGGVYAEVFDVKNSYEKIKPAEEQNLREPINRLTFGIVTKITIGSLLNVF
ncbi:hypothetical protein SAMN05421823_102268 [Catalinimonas alkaloidigena]|uniref:Uncharacterized protein n=1 Tax=Catalinimonas alkaloidigena TaxID=1075417 RepID=A0A1G9ADZ9_9BACT|nr:hypothetical protein [Catalinimonas alkaloidigena]SDK25597.1 hypothetical protein SAMN05421823_102268 [Catalinimonas alkaloidigena]